MMNLSGILRIAVLIPLVFILVACEVEGERDASSNTGSVIFEDSIDLSEPELRERFMNEELLEREEQIQLAKAMSLALDNMLLVDLNDCTEMFRSLYQPVRSLGDDPLSQFSVIEKQNIAVFMRAVTDARNRESARRFKENMTPVERQIQREGKRVSKGISMYNCEDDFSEIDGRYSTADKLNCQHLPEVTQSIEEIQLELSALWVHCIDVGWHFMENGNMDGFPINFDPSNAETDISQP